MIDLLRTPGKPAILAKLLVERDKPWPALAINGTLLRPGEDFMLPATAKATSIGADWERNSVVVMVEDESFAEVPDGDRPPECVGMLATGNPLAFAVSTLEHAINDDEAYRRTWHATFACAALDEGIDHETAQRIAARCVTALAPRAGRETSADPNG